MKFIPLLLLFCVTLPSLLRSGEFFVSPEGSDRGTGSSNAPFQTIQRGVNALKAGDTLTILPGSYHESVHWSFDGASDKVTAVRAQYPGTVLIHGDKAVSGFKAVPGRKNCYVLPFPRIPEAVNECDTYTVYKMDDAVLNSPHPSYGAYSYDAENKKLYIATSDGAPPSSHAISVSMIPRHGIYVTPRSPKGKVRNLVIDGLCIRGFAETAVKSHFNLWGIVIHRAEKCVVRNCSVYLNEGGIAMYNADRCLVEHSQGYANGSIKNVVSGNVAYFSSKNSTIDNCFSFRSRTYALKAYGTNFCNTISNSVSIGDMRGSIWIKPNDKGSRLLNTYSSGLVGCYTSANCVYHSNDYDKQGKGGPTSLALRKQHATAFPDDFADPWNFDLRLQKNSRFKHAFKGENVYFVSPSGSDKNDGRSVRSTWKTLKNTPDNATVYLLPGTYLNSMELTASNVTVAGRGQHGPILFRGSRKGIIVTGKNALLRRLNFEGQTESAVVFKGGKITLDRCVFSKQKYCITAQAEGKITITHSSFAPTASAIVSGEKLSGTFTHNISEKVPPQLVSFSNVSAPRKELSCDGLPFGPYFFQYLPQPLKAEHITVRPTSSATAEVFWSMNSTPAARLFYKEKSAAAVKCLNSYAKDSFFHTVSLKNLKPGTEYRFHLSFAPKMHYAVKSSYLPGIHTLPRKKKSVNTKFFTFRTPAADRTPRNWYVSVKGSDKNPGTEKAPFRTIARAALETAPGDTVIIRKGSYAESVFITSSGTAAKPVTFKAAPREEVWIRGSNRRYCRAFVLFGKEHLIFDGLRFKEFGTEFANASGSFVIFGGGNITISRCMHDGRGPGYSAPIFNVRNAGNVTLTQSVCIDGMTAMTMVNVDNIKVSNNVFKKPSIWTAALFNTGKGKLIFANNIVTDNIRAKTLQAPLYFSRMENLIERNNLYFMRLPRELRKIVDCTVNGKRIRMTLDEYYKQKGKAGGSFFADPGIKVLSTQLCWRNISERQAYMKSPMKVFRQNNIEENAHNPAKMSQYRHWNFKDFFAPALYKKHKIGLDDALFRDIAVDPQKGYDQR